MRLHGATMALLGLLAGCDAPERAAPVERVILISCDTLRADRLGVYGYPRPTSPELDRFARDAVVFEEAYSTAPMTTPAMSSLFTGRLPGELGVLTNKVQIAPEAISVTEIVQRAGVRTAAVVSNFVLARRGLEEAGLQQGFEHYDDRMTTREENRGHMFERDAAGTTDAALAWLDQRPGDRFFLWVHYQDPHGPYTPPAEDLAALERPLTGEPPLAVGQNQRGLGELPRYQALEGLREPEAYRIRYDAEIRYFDRELGRLLRRLEADDLLANALVIVTADHGESLGERDFWFSHGQHLHRELVRVPLIVRFPDDRPRPTAERRDGHLRVDRLVSHLDVLPTVLDAFGLTGPDVYGESLLVEELEPRITAHAGAGWFGVSDDRWRTMSHRSGTYLYDVAADPDETRNVAEDVPDELRDLLARFDRLRSSLPRVALEGVEVDRDAASLSALEALGYAGGDEDEEQDG